MNLLVTFAAQVQESLEQDPDNEELKKMEGDLNEVIELTEELLKEAPAVQAQQQHSGLPTRNAWQPGAECEARWSGDDEWYNAVVEEDIGNGRFRVQFVDYDETEEVGLERMRARPSLADSSAAPVAPSEGYKACSIDDIVSCGLVFKQWRKVLR